MNRRVLIATAIASLAIVTVALASEEVVTTSNTTQQSKQDVMAARREDAKAAWQAKQDELKAQREERLDQKCAMIQERVSKRITNYDTNKEKHMTVYDNMKERISKFADKLSGDGYDVSKIKTDLTTLDEKIQKFSTDYASQVAKLNTLKDLACGHSDGEFKAGIADARTMMKTVHADAMDIRKYMQETVRPDIQALKKQKVEAKTTEAALTAAETEAETK